VNPSVCAEPLDLLVLIDYWLNELPPSQEERIEEHLLGCAVCSESIDDLAR
jgi:putative zinc finger protein